MAQWKNFCNFIFYLYKRINDDHLFYVAAALTITTLLAIVPVISIFIRIFNLLPVFKHFDVQLNQFIALHLVPASGKLAQQYLQQFLHQAGELTIEGIVYLFAVALLTLCTIENAFNHIWRVKRGRRGVISFFLYWSILILAPLLVGVSFFLTSLLGSLPFFSGKFLIFNQTIIEILIFTLEVMSLTILYAVIPNKHVPLLNAVLGAIAAVIILTISKFVFILYITFFPVYQYLYGAVLSSIPLLIIWIYISWLIVLIVAEAINLRSDKS